LHRLKRDTSNINGTIDENSSYYDDDYSEDIDDDDTRIVNGYEADLRPWLAFLHIESSACGGALINKK
jgi:hypothetical protein